MSLDLPPEVTKALPSILGSFVSMLWIQDTWPRRIAMFLAGCFFAHFAKASAVRWSGLDEGFAGFLLGLFGMAVVAKLFDTWQRFELTALLTEAFRNLLHLPKKEG